MKIIESSLDVGETHLVLFRSKDNKGKIRTKSLVHPGEIALEELERAVNDEGKERKVHEEYLTIKEHMHKNHLGIYLMNNSKDIHLNVTLTFQLHNMGIVGHEGSEIVIHVPARSRDTFRMLKPVKMLETGSASYRMSFQTEQ